MWGVGVPVHLQPAAVRDRMVELGVIVRPIAPDTLVVCPPLVISDAELDQVVTALGTALS
jgi:adenosylmethionine-8-amino-7-oxononanoate aminotransferase